MIKHPERFLKEQEQERLEYLQSFTIEDSVRILESLLTSGLVEEFEFSDHRPISLARAIENARKRFRERAKRLRNSGGF